MTISSFYLDNEGEKLLDDSCGNSVLTEKEEIDGLFRF